MTDTLNVNVNIIPDMSAVEAALKKPRSIISKLPGHAARTLLSKMPSYEKPPKTMRRGEIATGDPFAAFKREKTQVGKVHLEPLNKIDLKKIGKLWKLDLYWKWIKGAWITLTKYVPLIGKLSDMFSAAIGLILTALIMPFLPEILSVLTGLLKASAGFFKWTMGKKEEIKTFAELGFDTILAVLGLSGIVKAFEFIAVLLTKISPLFKIFGDILKPVITWLGEKGLGGVLKGLVAFLAKFVDPLLWATLLAEISGYIFDWIKGWSDNPTWQAFWGGMAELARIVSEITDVFGWVIDIFTGKGFDRIGKIGGEIADFGAGIKKALGIKGTLFGEGGLQWEGADGGIVTQPTRALIGEAGPEAIVPLDQLGNFGGGTNVKVFIDGKEFRGMIREEIEKSNRRLYNVRGSVGI